MVATPRPSDWNGRTQPKVVQTAMPPAGGGFNNSDIQLHNAQVAVVTQGQADGFNVSLADLWKGWPESGGINSYFEHTVGSYANGLQCLYAASPHYNNCGNTFNAWTQARAASRIPYPAPEVSSGSSDTLTFSKVGSKTQGDVNTQNFDLRNRGNLHSQGVQQTLTGTPGTIGRQVQATGSTTTPATIVQSHSMALNGTGTFSGTVTAGNAVVAIIEQYDNSSAPTITDSNGDTFVRTNLGVVIGGTVNGWDGLNVYIAKNVVGGSTTFTATTGNHLSGGWFEVHNLNQTLPLEPGWSFASSAANIPFPNPTTSTLSITEPSDLLVGFSNDNCVSINGNPPWLFPSQMTTNLPAGNFYNTYVYSGAVSTTLGPNVFTLNNYGVCGAQNVGTYWGVIALRSVITTNQTADLDQWKDENGNVVSSIDHAGTPHGNLAAGGYPSPETHTASSSAELDFTSCITSSYQNYVVKLTDMQVATNAAALLLQFSTNGGSTYDTSSIYQWATPNVNTAGSAGSNNQNSVNGIAVSIAANNASGLQSAANPANSITLNINNPLGTTTNKTVTGYGGIGQYNNGTVFGYWLMGFYNNNSAVNAFRIIASSGNIASGQVTCQPQPQ
jgi:hypothetical protein